jgi:hypothetical protein
MWPKTGNSWISPEQWIIERHPIGKIVPRNKMWTTVVDYFDPTNQTRHSGTTSHFCSDYSGVQLIKWKYLCYSSFVKRSHMRLVRKVPSSACHDMCCQSEQPVTWTILFQVHQMFHLVRFYDQLWCFLVVFSTASVSELRICIKFCFEAVKKNDSKPYVAYGNGTLLQLVL